MKPDWEALRRRVAALEGPAYWRGLGELAETPEVRAALEREFPEEAAFWERPVDRREFIKVMGAMLAMMGLSACGRQPLEKIVPYVKAPEDIVPGKPLYFATASLLDGYARGVLVESHMGRPTKIEGNPGHPDSLGSADIFALASILTLYDPDRSQTVLRDGLISTWDAMKGGLAAAMADVRAKGGAGFRILTGAVTSPTLAAQIRALLAELPEARWHAWEPLDRSGAREGSRRAFGEVFDVRYRFDRADAVLSLDADFLSPGPGHTCYARDFASKRRVKGPGGSMSRLYALASTPSLVSAAADHRLILRHGEIAAAAAAVAAELGIAAARRLGAGARLPEGWAVAVARDLARRKGGALVVAGETQPAAVHALAHAMNAALGSAGRTAVYTAPVEASPTDRAGSLAELARDMHDGRVETLVVADSNPVYTAPADLGFAEAFARVRARIHTGLYADETAHGAQWHVPLAHTYESWGDARAFDGTATVLQPLTQPLYNGRSAHELLEVLAGRPGRPGYESVREHWRARSGAADFEAFWRRALHEGVVAGTAFGAKRPALAAGFDPGPAPRTQGMEIIFRPDPTVRDGAWSNNAWLQELPKPLLQFTWDNAALVSPGTAERLGLAPGDVAALELAGRRVEAPVWIAPGHPDESVTVHLGYGRARGGKVGAGAGFNAYRLRTLGALASAGGLAVKPAGRRHALAATQEHHRMENRGLVREATLARFGEEPDFARRGEHPPKPSESFYPAFPAGDYAWGMSIDLTACIGCNACMVACQSENNIPVVGREQVLRGREMHWIRVDRYYEGPPDDPAVVHQPVPCMHCENAPCEPVCPVGATVHSAEGLNEMVYNRCVGTRYCSNNCPYKVRRFNFLNFTGDLTQGEKLMMNPDVTIRSRGVMEKCTYCVQRINAARIEAKKEDRRIRDGEVVTACQQACPVEAIVFGDAGDPQSRVSKEKAGPLAYGLLEHLQTRPRTTYAAKLRNPNPELEGRA